LGKHVVATGLDVLAEARQVARRDVSPRAKFSSETAAFVNYWFPKKSQAQLSALATAIRGCPDKTLRALFWSIFSSLVIVKSAGPSYALDLAHSRPHRNLLKDIVFPFDAWEPKLKRAVARKSNVVPLSSARIRIGDARRLPLSDESVDLVLTSPPYLHAIDYIRAHKFALVWMGEDIESLRELRGTLIGSERGMFQPDGLPNTTEVKLQNAQRSSPERTRRYFSDMLRCLVEARRVLRRGGAAVFAVGDSMLSATRRDAGQIMTELGRAAGFTVGSVGFRRLAARRRSLPPPHLVDDSLSKR